jgi:hypothetical protein
VFGGSFFFAIFRQIYSTKNLTAQVVPKPHPLPPLHCVAEGEKQVTGGLESLLSINMERRFRGKAVLFQTT